MKLTPSTPVIFILIIFLGPRNLASLMNLTEFSPNYAGVTVGSKAMIPEWEWVSVANDSPITQIFTNGSNELVAGETCAIEFDGQLIVKEVRGANILVEYKAPGQPIGTRCPSGTLFVMNKSAFRSMNRSYIAVTDALKAEQDTIERLLAENYHGKIIDAGDSRWIKVVNPIPILQAYRTGFLYLDYGSTCGISFSYDGADHIIKGTMQVRGESDGKVLYEYTIIGDATPIGTPCPSGVLFFE